MTIHQAIASPGCGCDGQDMLKSLISIDEALARIAAQTAPVGRTEAVSPDSAAGRILAQPVRSRSRTPSFDNAAMDGYAVAGGRGGPDLHGRTCAPWRGRCCDAAGRHSPKALRPARKRQLVDGMLVDWGVSIRRACRALRFDASTCHYKSRRPGQAALEPRIRQICETRVRYGYRHVHVLLRREGWLVNMKKTRRIYNELGLQLRNKHPKRRVKAKLREDRQECGRAE